MTESFYSVLWRYAQPHRAVIAIGIVALLAEAAVTLLLPWLGGRLADALFGNPATQWSSRDIVLALAGLFTLQAAMAVGGRYLFSKRAAQILAALRLRAFSHLLALPLPYFHARKEGESLSLLSSDVWQVSNYLSGAIVGVIPAVVTGLGSIAVMFFIDARMALAACVAIPFFYVIIKLLGRSLRPLAQQLRDERMRAFAIEAESLAALPAIKIAGRETLETDRYRESVKRIVQITLRQDWREAALGPAMVWVASMGLLAILWVAGQQTHSGELSKGTLVTFLLYTALLTRPVGRMATFHGETQHAIIALKRLQSLFVEPMEVYGKTHPDLLVNQGAVRFAEVFFAYPERGDVFRNFSLDIAAGKVTAITGENGVGKSSLVSLLLRIHRQNSGKILIDGHDLNHVSLASVRASIGYVSQSIILIHASVRENIAYARPNATLAEIERAADLAQAGAFIRALPEGMETIVGDRGVRLSGGQKQRIALARELLRDPPILVLDEATSMFDPEAELEFLKDAQSVLRQRTVILITHRPASLSLADEILHFSDGGATSPSVMRTVVRK